MTEQLKHAIAKTDDERKPFAERCADVRELARALREHAEKNPPAHTHNDGRVKATARPTP